MNIKPICQRDACWRYRPLGTSTQTIGDAGCLLTCVAMVAQTVGHDVTPSELNALLVHTGGFEDGNVLRWYAVCDVLPLRVAGYGDCEWIPAPMKVIDNHLTRGLPVICRVDRFAGVPDDSRQHWVLLLDVAHNYADPWDAAIRVMADPAHQILNWWVYEPAGG